jgi:hypothetical protein
MDSVHMVLLTLHVTAASWLFGLGLRPLGSLDAVLELGGEPLRRVAAEAASRGRLAVVASGLTLASGLGLLFWVYGGFAKAPPTLHAALSLVGLLLGLQLGVAAPALGALRRAAEAPALDSAALAGARGRVLAVSGAGHLIWLVVLVLMFVR